ncbi:TM0106 family RecB-like putative nuclease [Leifsonia shinshuensis]|uniref:TM0106 family RecB-like putative nuclease n=1 Tax=Leifsonia shinshuensis TaxID=150026 RepID=A0A7G6Y5V5_9MICO|nr:bifunctional RecB family nuclease/DEAD/DEAH box helicase [Leifsonia shinshuensis]QNE33870.1 TM0106 family RecB-like putative nuclease [Leifsonia shinshuensis]
MFLLDGVIVTSASDLTEASKCEFAFLRTLDVKLGRLEKTDEVEDPMYVRSSRLGDEQEHHILERYRERFGDGVAEIERPESLTADSLAEAVRLTADAFARASEVVFQATFFDGSFVGFADFIVRLPDGRYRVQDSKLARSARVTALLQLAAYAEQLRRTGVEVDETVELLLGDGSVSEHRLSDIEPVYRKRRARLLDVIAEHVADAGPVEWGDPRFTVCGRCDTCDAEIVAARDVLLVAGMRVTQRERLAAAGITTIDALAATTGPVEGIPDGTLAGLREQARLQLEAVEGAPPPVRVFNAPVLAVLPEPDAGDIFFDFEGDPLYTEGAGERWNLDYLFGMVDTDARFTAFWAHDFAEERVALERFLEFVRDRRAAHPGMHIYHYAAYEQTHLLSISARHGVGEEEVDGLLRDNVMVDLYPLVRKSVRVGSRSYSIKKLEPLYMGSELRESEVTNGADSITEYANARDLIALGRFDEAQPLLDALGDYNRYDCVSTLRLRDWLLARAAEAGVPIGAAPMEEPEPAPEESPLRAGLLGFAGDPLDPHRTPDREAVALAAAAIDFHRREQKSFWQSHFSRLIQPVEEWADTRDVLVVESVRVVRDWYLDEGQRVERRELLLSGQWGAGSAVRVSESSGPFLLYEYPGPFRLLRAQPGARTVRSAAVIDVTDDGSVLVRETLPEDVAAYPHLPMALTPAPPPNTRPLAEAVREWGTDLLAARRDDRWPLNATVDLLRRTPPRTRSGALAPEGPEDGSGRIAAVTASLLDLDASYLAVQGPPGTGKSYLGAHVIARLVAAHGWRVGVVAQSHAVVENLLDRVVDTGLDPALVGKVPSGAAEAPRFTPLRRNGHLEFAAEREGRGYVLGGTAWDFANPARIPRGSLDLLVIDEAGQFSLASTIAVGVAARNLLLLGDPQQLPQVSQGSHPEPVDGSALGWVSAGHDVLPAELGYFLAESRRMHPALAEAVSRLSYEGRLHAHPSARDRELGGVEPGLHPAPVEHVGDATASPQEAAEVVRIVDDLIGRSWTDPAAHVEDVPLAQDDVIVVTPYNAQLAEVRELLDEAGFPQVRVGTVDKFQGQEAAVAIVSLAASSAADVPRGMSFLLMKNRLNVAISRAKWAAYLVHSPELTEFLPTTPAGVGELSAFIRLVEPAGSGRPAPSTTVAAREAAGEARA